MTSREFTEWKAFDSVEPIGDRRDDFRFAMLSMFILAPHSKEPPKLGSMMEMFDFWRQPEAPPEMNPEDQSAAILNLFGVSQDYKPLQPGIEVKLLGADGKPIS